jgi:excisionase family DNA binding protein
LMANGYVVLGDAARELKMSEEELKKLMEEGKIRHFMDGGKIKFRRKDLDDLKASLGIAQPEESELTLAPPEELPPLPAAEEIPPPPAEEADIEIEPLEEISRLSAAAPPAAPPGEEPPAEEIASLSEFEIGEEVEEEGEEISEEEAQLLSMETPGFRTYQEPEAASVGMTVVLVAAIVVIAFGAVTLLSFVMGYNPLSGLTNYFVE